MEFHQGRETSSDTTNVDVGDQHLPQHLSEFLSFSKARVGSGSSSKALKGNKMNADDDDVGTDEMIARRPSITTFTSFSPSVLDLPSIVTSRDFQKSLVNYNQLTEKAENLRLSLLEVSKAANEFGSALEDTINEVPKVNNAKTVNDGILNAAGLQYMIGSNQQILSKIMEQSFVQPLKKEIKSLEEQYNLNYKYYQQEVKQKSKTLREAEKENLKLSKKKTRNLNIYKKNLANLTTQLEEIDRLKYDYYHEVNSMLETFNSKSILLKAGSLVRAQLEIYEGVAKKGWTGGGLDDLLSLSPDLFEVIEESHSQEKTNLLDGSNVAAHENFSRVHNPGGYSDVDVHEDTAETVIIENGDDNASTLSRGRSLNRDFKPYINDEEDRYLGHEDNLLKHAKQESVDESFSLPVVNTNNSIFSQKAKHSDEPNSPKSLDSASKSNILDELDTEPANRTGP